MAFTGQPEHLTTDVAVIGGGPAGSAAAAMLARQGWRVVLLERDRFPREHVGESLLPASVPILEELGALDAVRDAGFLPKYGATMVWGRDPEPWSWFFRETSQRYPSSFQVWRPKFDQILLDNARALGVDVREGHRVTFVDLPNGHYHNATPPVRPDTTRTPSVPPTLPAPHPFPRHYPHPTRSPRHYPHPTRSP